VSCSRCRGIGARYFVSVVEALRRVGQLIALPVSHQGPADHEPFHGAVLRCRTCRSVWDVDLPDHAFQGHATEVADPGVPDPVRPGDEPTISPYARSATLPSPDGRLLARIDEAVEVTRGGPTSGTLVVTTGLTAERCNPSMVWSLDSETLAVPQWDDRGSAQQLLLLSAHARLVRVVPGRHRMLELYSFQFGTVRGMDADAPLELDVREHLDPS
jgi:hypothetical protein